MHISCNVDTNVSGKSLLKDVDHYSPSKLQTVSTRDSAVVLD